jgi:hypothetical protein
VAPEPSPAVRSAVIDIFSPRGPEVAVGVDAGDETMRGASGMSSLTSGRTVRSSDETRQASGGVGGGGAGINTSGATANGSGQPRVRKKATFSETVTAAVAGEGGGLSTAVGHLQPSESMGKDETLGGRSSVTAMTGAGSWGMGLESEDEEDGESIVAIKHKLTLLEKQQDVETFSIERYTSRLITFWYVRV